MTIFRLLLLGLAIWIIWKLLRTYRVHISREQPPTSPPNYEAMAQCKQCGVHLPASALSSDGCCGKCLKG